MVSVSNNVNNIITGTCSPSAGVTGTAKPSIYMYEGPSQASINNEQETTLYHKLENEIKNLLSQYKGVTYEDLENIRKEFKLDNVQVNKLTEEKIQKFVKFMKEQLDAAVVDGSVDIKKLKNKIQNKVEEYNFLNKGLVGMLIQRGYIKKSDIPEDAHSLKQVDQTVVKNAVNNFLNDVINKVQTSGKSSVQQKEEKLAIIKNLIAGTNDEDKIILWNALKESLKENNLVKDTITAMLKSYVNSPELQKMLQQISSEDLSKLGINGDDFTTSIRNAMNSQNPDDFIKILDLIINNIEAFYKENHEFVQKVYQYESTHPEADIETVIKDLNLNDKEIEKLRILKNYELMLTGSASNAAERNIDIQQQINKYSQFTGEDAIKELCENVKEYINKHKDEFGIEPEKIAEFMDKMTKGVYTGNTEAYADSKVESSHGSESKSGIGYENDTKTPDTLNLQLIQQAVLDTVNSAKNTFEVVVSSNKKESFENNGNNHSGNISFAGMSAVVIQTAIQSGIFKSTTDAVTQAINDYNNLTQSAKKWVTDTIGNMSKSCRKYLFKQGLAGDLVRYLVKQKLITKEELNNGTVVTSTDVKKLCKSDLT